MDLIILNKIIELARLTYASTLYELGNDRKIEFHKTKLCVFVIYCYKKLVKVKFLKIHLFINASK